MAIPLTCPGCQAAFEVPDTLSGKTIRCTSCKTQLTVPAAGAADAKKPFGWSTSPSKPAAALSLNDDKPAAKANGTTKAALARPVAKAAVAVVEDDDEDDRKTSPNKPAAKGGSKITGAPKKRRDDDDDDDDDDQPRRKKRKNTSGGSGAMIALIGGGVVCLAAVVGLSVWLLSGDKKDTAKSDSNNTNSTPAPSGRPEGEKPDDGGRPAPGDGDGAMTVNKPGRPGVRPNGANPGGDANWQPVSADGLSCEMPGTPTKISQVMAGFGAMSIHRLADPSTKFNYATITITLPPSMANQPSAVLLNSLVQQAEQDTNGFGGGLSGGEQLTVTGKSDVTQDGFPGKELRLSLKATQQTVGTLRVFVAGPRLHIVAAIANDYVTFQSMQSKMAQFFASVKITGSGGGGVAAGDGGGDPGINAPPSFPGGGFPGGPPPGVGFPGGPPSGIPGRPPGFPGGAQPPGIGGIPGRPPGDGGDQPAGIGGIGGGIQPPGVGGAQPPGIPGRPPGFPGGAQPPGVGGIPGRPPGAPGRPPVGGPPGGGGPAGLGGDGPTPGGPGFGQPADPNAAPFGVVTNGKKKATLTPQFFTGVFDSSKKEFFSFSTQPENKGKSVTRLNRYDVAKSFAAAGSYKLPHFVSRAVIDPAKGHLYAATINTPTAVNAREQYDQTAGVGDVAVFDLNVVRNGGIAEGADLKPLGIFPVGSGKKIHGLELSPDGKTLIVLTTTISTNPKNAPKSFLTRYDTETRKPLENTKPTPLAEPAWDMSKSHDGKFLIVVDLAVGQGKAAHVRSFDIETLSAVKSLPLQGTANDAAMAPGGQFAGIVAGPAGSKLLFANAEDTKEFDLGFGWKAAAKPGYVRYSPDGKLLFVSGHVGMSGGRHSAGLDVYEVKDPDSPTGLKKKASITTAGEQAVGGHFFVSPDGDYLVFHTGVVVAAHDVGGSNGEVPGGAVAGGGAGAPGLPGGAAAPGPMNPGGAGPGGVPDIATPGAAPGVPGRPPVGAPGGAPDGKPPVGGTPGGKPPVVVGVPGAPPGGADGSPMRPPAGPPGQVPVPPPQ